MNINHAVTHATPDPDKGKLDFYYKPDPEALAISEQERKRKRLVGTSAFKLAGGGSVASVLERAAAVTLAGMTKNEITKEGWYRGFTEEIRAISLGHSLRQ